MGYKNTAIKGISWMWGFRVFSRFVSILRIAILARLLTPQEFGIFGIASLILNVVENFTQSGISTLLVQIKSKISHYKNEAFVISIIRGSVICVLIFLFSGKLSNFFNSPEASAFIKLAGVVALIRGFINPFRVTFLKELNYKKEVFFSTGVFIVDTLVSVISVILLRSPLGLMYGLIAGAIVEVTLSHFLVKVSLQLSVSKKKIFTLLNQGKWITGSSSFMFIYEQVDSLMVGKLLGSYSLGIYQVAYKVATFPVTEIAKVANQVVYPIYVKIGDSDSRIKRAYLRTAAVMFLLSVGVSVLIYLFSEKVILLILGKGWVEMTYVLKILSVFSPIRVLIISVNPLFNALKRQDIITRVAFINLLILVVCIYPATLYFGLSGVGYSIIASSIVTLPIIYYYLIKILRT